MTAYAKNFTACRAFGHQWKPTRAVIKPAGPSGGKRYIQGVKCSCCETTKSIIMMPSGLVTSNIYDYPEGYALKGRMTRDRRAQMRRSTFDG